MFFVRFVFCLVVICSSIACTSSSSSPPPGSPGIDGTSDTGGGNGIENKAYEAYIIRPERLPAFEKLILPKIEKLIALAPRPDMVLPIFQRWLLYKTWYIAPIKLGTISKDVIGVSFSDDQTEQLALQTKKSVWINSERFARMTPDDQAILIAHEMIMSLYYLKFKSWSDVCTEKIYPDIQCNDQDKDILNEIFPGTTPKPFDADDYENIRAVTGLLLDDSNYSTTRQIDDLLMRNNFDRRFTFGLGLDSGVKHEGEIIYDTSVEITSSELQQILDSAAILNQLPDRCQGLRLGTFFDCNFSFSRKIRKLANGANLPLLALKTVGKSPGSSLSFEVSTSALGSHPGTSIEFVKEKIRISYFVFTPEPAPTPLIVGATFRSAVLVTLEDLFNPQAPRTLLGIVSTPGVVTGIQSDGLDCIYAKPSTTSIQDDVIMVSSKYLSNYDTSFLRVRAISQPPITFCRIF